MVKINSREVEAFDFFRSIWDTKVFFSKVPVSKALLYCIGELLVLLGLTILFSFKRVESFLVDLVLVSLIGVPIFILAIFFFFYLFVSAFEGKSFAFWESFLVFSSVVLHFIIIGNLLTNLTYVSFFVARIARVLLLFVVVYFIVNMVMNMRTYFHTSWQRILAGFVLVDILFGVLIVIQYFSSILLQM